MYEINFVLERNSYWNYVKGTLIRDGSLDFLVEANHNFLFLGADLRGGGKGKAIGNG